MPTQKKVIIGTRKNLVEATVHNRSEVVEYLQQHNWHLDTETFIGLRQTNTASSANQRSPLTWTSLTRNLSARGVQLKPQS